MVSARGGLVLALAGPAVATVLAAAYVLFGHTFVGAIYDQRMPVELLNQIITGQAIHPVEYHLQRADALVGRLTVLLYVEGLLVGAWLWSCRRWPASVLRWPLVGAVLLITGLLWGVHLLEVPLLQVFPGWFWPLRPKPLPAVWLFVPLAAVSYAVVRGVVAAPSRRRRNLLLLVAWGAFLHHGFAWMEGRGLDTMRARFTDSGHGVFARAAVEQESLWRVLTRYDEMLDAGELSPYFHSTKPPGLQVFLGLAQRLSEAAFPVSGGRLERLATFAALAFPLLGAATVIPLLGVVRLFASERVGMASAALYLLAPSVVLINLHADHYLHPLLGLTFLYLSLRALQRDAARTAALAGAACYLGLWVSFALAPLVLVPAVVAWSTWRPGRAGPALRTASAAVAGFAGTYLLFYLAFDYDAAHRFAQAMSAHQAAKIQEWGAGSRLYFGCLNLVEFAVWCAPPLALLCVADLYRTAARATARPLQLGDGLALGLLCVLVALAVFGRTAAESARLWMFLVPLAAVCAARQLERLPANMRGKALGLVLSLQAVTVLVLKRYQDFF